jgi:hypothetical protein
MNYLRMFPLGTLFLFLATSQLEATTVVFVVTPTGMVIGADSKTQPSGMATKIFLLKDRLAVADLYAETAKINDRTTTLYDFPAWVKQIDHNTSPKVSVSEMTEIIKDEMTSTFAFAIDAIKSGELTEAQAVAEGFGAYLVQFIIAGYQQGVPTVYSLTLVPDWNTKTVNGPFEVRLNPEKGQNTNSRVFWRGQGIGIKRVMIANSKEQRKLAARIPVEFQALRNSKILTIHQASNIARALLGVEAESNPKYVGFPVTLVTILKIGRATVSTIKRDVPTLSSLPKKTLGNN